MAERENIFDTPKGTPRPEPQAKPALQLKSQKFREARQGDWRTLNSQLDKLDRQGLNSFSVDELLNLPVLYRSAVSSLSMAQSISLDRNLITYLQALCARAYVHIYGPQTRLKEVFGSFFLKAWPRSVRALWPEIALSLIATIAGAIIGWLLCAHDASWYDMFLPGDERNVGASVEDLRKSLGGNPENYALSPFAVMLMTHNTQVAIMAFALGAIFGLPTLALLIENGIVLGAMLWLFFSRGLGIEFAAWLSIHGTTEILAIILAGAAGFHIARKIMFPGDATRKVALAEAGRLTGTVMIGVAIMLTVAGCLEGIGRQTITNTAIRIGIGVTMLTVWCLFYSLVGRGKDKGSHG
ncbi:MAG: stage II sporulation protein M [Asticcacaulis sp.]|nr:stage II sporulation protein M [Asticcacaulis sp.]